uniref:Secreted protein n=1 Tax=Capra hircus TaxID=9925 RepID=A0A8C2P5G9_CAPHI
MFGKVVAAVTFLWLLDQGSLVAWSLPWGTRCFSVQSSLAGEEVTHTGQFYDPTNYRQLSFVGCQREVNENSTIDLIAEQPVSEVRRQVVSCDRNEGIQGQPRCT